jgi:hypothetical protein
MPDEQAIIEVVVSEGEVKLPIGIASVKAGIGHASG